MYKRVNFTSRKVKIKTTYVAMTPFSDPDYDIEKIQNCLVYRHNSNFPKVGYLCSNLEIELGYCCKTTFIGRRKQYPTVLQRMQQNLKRPENGCISKRLAFSMD